MFHSLPEPVTQLMNGKLPADHPGAGIFRPVCDTLEATAARLSEVTDNSLAPAGQVR
jgi:hypothetical protein